MLLSWYRGEDCTMTESLLTVTCGRWATFAHACSQYQPVIVHRDWTYFTPEVQDFFQTSKETIHGLEVYKVESQ